MQCRVALVWLILRDFTGVICDHKDLTKMKPNFLLQWRPHFSLTLAIFASRKQVVQPNLLKASKTWPMSLRNKSECQCSTDHEGNSLGGTGCDDREELEWFRYVKIKDETTNYEELLKRRWLESILEEDLGWDGIGGHESLEDQGGVAHWKWDMEKSLQDPVLNAGRWQWKMRKKRLCWGYSTRKMTFKHTAVNCKVLVISSSVTCISISAGSILDILYQSIAILYLWTFDIDTWWYRDTSIYIEWINDQSDDTWAIYKYRVSNEISSIVWYDSWSLKPGFTSNANLRRIP